MENLRWRFSARLVAFMDLAGALVLMTIILTRTEFEKRMRILLNKEPEVAHQCNVTVSQFEDILGALLSWACRVLAAIASVMLSNSILLLFATRKSAKLETAFKLTVLAKDVNTFFFVISASVFTCAFLPGFEAVSFSLIVVTLVFCLIRLFFYFIVWRFNNEFTGFVVSYFQEITMNVINTVAIIALTLIMMKLQL